MIPNEEYFAVVLRSDPVNHVRRTAAVNRVDETMLLNVWGKLPQAFVDLLELRVPPRSY